nr:8380_t:CDS:2 [Entrophospora candida]
MSIKSQLSSKYSNIPDITQPDVYESPDTPEEKLNENIVKEKISVDKAVDKFKGSIIDASETDFTDSITHCKKKHVQTQELDEELEKIK